MPLGAHTFATTLGRLVLPADFRPDTLHSAYYVVDKAGAVIALDDTLAFRLGYAPSDLIGKSFTAFVCPDYREFALMLHEAVFDGSSDPSKVWTLKSKSGELVKVLVDSVHVTTPDGQPVMLAMASVL
jgi:PAS domain S-box-containing protein